MARGGVRKGAGRKSTWVSGCKFSDTKLIRVPKLIASRLLSVAHRIDSGEDIDLKLISLENRQQQLLYQVELLAKRNALLCEEIEQYKQFLSDYNILDKCIEL